MTPPSERGEHSDEPHSVVKTENIEKERRGGERSRPKWDEKEDGGGGDKIGCGENESVSVVLSIKNNIRFVDHRRVGRYNGQEPRCKAHYPQR